MTTTAMKLGDKVSGNYYGSPFTGTLVGFDSSGVEVACDAGFSHGGQRRDGIYIFHGDRARFDLRVTAPAPALTWDDVGEWQGHVYLR